MASEDGYAAFLRRKSQLGGDSGFEPPWLPDFLFDFQRHLVDWAVRKGRAAIFADCGLGKTPMQLVWAENVVRHTGRPVLIATPLAVGQQTVREAEKFGVDARQTRGGRMDGTARVWVTNYEQLHHYDPSRFAGMVCDESSAIKDFKTARKKAVVEFMREMPYRLLCTATPAPNDFWELGTSSESLGYLGFRDMITAFFKQETSKDNRGWGRTKYRFRGHAEEPFWAWVCSWARAIRRPSDLGPGFDDAPFTLPPLSEQEVLVGGSPAGALFPVPAATMQEERAERRRTLRERCEAAAGIANAHPGPCVVWCELNPEGDLLARLVKDAVQVKGSMKDDEREEALAAFTAGQVRRLVIKPKIGAWGLNWQHCNGVVVLPSHSYERYFQLVRRCWRFGQALPVSVWLVLSQAEQGILGSLRRKQWQADRMFSMAVRHMGDALALARKDSFPVAASVPGWLKEAV